MRYQPPIINFYILNYLINNMHLNKQEAEQNKQAIIDDIKEGKVFIYPTDTIYGLGCDATNEEAVKRIRDLKQSYDQAFSIIPPSKQWILDNCKMNPTIQEWINKLPGPYTLILSLITDTGVAESLLQGRKTLGIRIPAHWFTEIAQESGVPVVTTSVNIHGQPFITDLSNQDLAVDFTINEGPKSGKPSTVVDLTQEQPKITER